MPNRPRTTARLEQKLLTLTLGSAAATGVSLPEKAEATIVAGPSGIIVNDTIYTALTGVLNINLNLLNSSDPINLSQGFYGGWNIFGDFFTTGSVVFFTLGGISRSGLDGTYTYFVFSNGIYSDTQNFDLSTFDISNFSPGTSFFESPTTVDTWFVGLRRTSSGGPDINGWAQVQFGGDVTHLQSAFNFSNPSSIAIGQIPEPTSALLLTAGSTGLLAARRRRNKTA